MPILGKAIIAIRNLYEKELYDRQSKVEANLDNKLVSFLQGSPLTKDEQQLVAAKWWGVTRCVTRGYKFYEGLKKLRGFDANYLPACYYYPYIERMLNPDRWKSILSHKSMIEIAYGIGVKHPNTILRSYGGVYLDHDFKPLLLSDAIAKVQNSGFALLFKPATESNQGRGIKLYKSSDIDDLCKAIKSSEILNSGDFLLQELLTQSRDTAIYNSSSLNCMRITTLNLNGEVSVCTRAIKCGGKDFIVDNVGNVKRGVIVGIDNDGNLNDKGFYGNGEIVTSHNGVEFQGKKIKAFARVLDTAIQLHKYVPSCRLIGWDIALDANDDPVLIEGNVFYPGLSLEQMCSGPVFGERTDEVIEFLKR